MKITKLQIDEGEKIPKYYLISKYDFECNFFYADIFYIAIPKIIYYKVNVWYHRIFKFNSLEIKYRKLYNKGFQDGVNNYNDEKEIEAAKLKKEIMRLEMLVYLIVNPLQDKLKRGKI